MNRGVVWRLGCSRSSWRTLMFGLMRRSVPITRPTIIGSHSSISVACPVSPGSRGGSCQISKAIHGWPENIRDTSVVRTVLTSVSQVRQTSSPVASSACASKIS